MNSESLMLLQAIYEGMDQVFEELRPRRFLAGEEIVAEGAPLTSLLLLSSGVCQVRWQGLSEEA